MRVQVRSCNSGKVRFCQVGLGYIRLGHVNFVSSGYVRLSQVTSCNFRLRQVFRLGMVRSN
jgi:hypothetical protein